MNSREYRRAENNSVNEKRKRTHYMFAQNRIPTRVHTGKALNFFFFFLMECKKNQEVIFLKTSLVLLNRINYLIYFFC